jgi:hypothetical protein
VVQISAAVLAVIVSDLDLIGRLRTLAQQIGVTLIVARSGEEAIQYLRGVGVYSNRLRYPVPAAILLDTCSDAGSDLNVLSWLRENPVYLDLPVGLLTREPLHRLHVLCALDPACFLVDRDTLRDFAPLMLNSCAAVMRGHSNAAVGTRAQGNF